MRWALVLFVPRLIIISFSVLCTTYLFYVILERALYCNVLLTNQWITASNYKFFCDRCRRLSGFFDDIYTIYITHSLRLISFQDLTIFILSGKNN